MRFRNHRVVGEIVDLARTYCRQGADELVFYDITASPDGRTVDREWVARVAEVVDVPFCVAGGIRSIADAEDILYRGADKVSVNSPALARPTLITDLATRFGTQCVVVGIDSMKLHGNYSVYRDTGNSDRTRSTGRQTIDWIIEAQDRGAGEIVLNCMNQDGVRRGYDIRQLSIARQRSNVPLVASGGAGTCEHFVDVFKTAGVDAALAASVFHDSRIGISQLKDVLAGNDLEVRRE